jgi:hypothetical protein
MSKDAGALDSPGRIADSLTLDYPGDDGENVEGNSDGMERVSADPGDAGEVCGIPVADRLRGTRVL